MGEPFSRHLSTKGKYVFSTIPAPGRAQSMPGLLPPHSKQAMLLFNGMTFWLWSCWSQVPVGEESAQELITAPTEIQIKMTIFWDAVTRFGPGGQSCTLTLPLRLLVISMVARWASLCVPLLCSQGPQWTQHSGPSCSGNFHDVLPVESISSSVSRKWLPNTVSYTF